MMLKIATVALLSLSLLARAEGDAPATQPPAAVPFELVQESSIGGRPKVVATFRFAGNYALMLNEASEVTAVYNLAASTTYIERHDRMVAESFIADWLTGWRLGAAAKQLLTDPRQEPFVRSLLWPKLDVEEAEGQLRIRTKAMHLDVVPMPKARPAAATAYAAFYKLEAYRNAFENQSATGAYIAAAIADELRARNVVPQSMKITTYTPSGSAVMTVALQHRELDPAEIAEVGTLAKQFDVPPAK